MRSIFIVSEIRSLTNKASSTHMLTANLLRGFKQNGCKVIFFAIVLRNEEKQEVYDYYSKLVDYVIVLDSFYGVISSKYKRLLKMIRFSISEKKYLKHLQSKDIFGLNPDCIIVHAPSFEAVHYGNSLKKLFRCKLINLWSDPIALAGINPEDINYKRFMHILVERRAVKKADQTLYFTKTLMSFQIDVLGEKFKKKIGYIDMPYIDGYSNEHIYKNRVLYSGNYYSSIRNIAPLVSSISFLNDIYLDVYGDGDISLTADRVVFHERVAPDEIRKVENMYRVVVSLLNKKCIQIPGKIFYPMNTNQRIVVIADGIHKNEIISYLNEFNRFIVCENNENEIANAITKAFEGSLSSFDSLKYSSFSICKKIIEGD